MLSVFPLFGSYFNGFHFLDAVVKEARESVPIVFREKIEDAMERDGLVPLAVGLPLRDDRFELLR